MTIRRAYSLNPFKIKGNVYNGILSAGGASFFVDVRVYAKVMPTNYFVRNVNYWSPNAFPKKSSLVYKFLTKLEEKFGIKYNDDY